MSDFKHKDKEQLSRQQAAERLTDIAYALTTGGSLRLNGVDQVIVPVADELALEQEIKSDGDRVELELELSWSKATAARPAPPPAVSRE
jgi:amphi-Trp domain-containing protein